MTIPVIGPSFVDELAAADPTLIGSPLSWDSAGNLYNLHSLTSAQQTTVARVLAAHNYRLMSKQDYRNALLGLFDRTDRVALRCNKVGVAYTQAWQAVDQEIRTALARMDVTQPLPTLPSTYPPGS